MSDIDLSSLGLGVFVCGPVNGWSVEGHHCLAHALCHSTMTLPLLCVGLCFYKQHGIALAVATLLKLMVKQVVITFYCLSLWNIKMALLWPSYYFFFFTRTPSMEEMFHFLYMMEIQKTS